MRRDSRKPNKIRASKRDIRDILRCLSRLSRLKEALLSRLSRHLSRLSRHLSRLAGSDVPIWGGFGGGTGGTEDFTPNCPVCDKGTSGPFAREVPAWAKDGFLRNCGALEDKTLALLNIGVTFVTRI
jgi:hypothetical protein